MHGFMTISYAGLVVVGGNSHDQVVDEIEQAPDSVQTGATEMSRYPWKET